MTREEIIEAYESAVFSSGLSAAAGNEEAARDYELLKAGLNALRGPTREQVEKVWRGEWKHYLPPLGAGNIQCRCTKCGITPDVETPFCAWCGAPRRTRPCRW